jgi:hypothetical protein
VSTDDAYVGVHTATTLAMGAGIRRGCEGTTQRFAPRRGRHENDGDYRMLSTPRGQYRHAGGDHRSHRQADDGAEAAVAQAKAQLASKNAGATR